MISVASRSTTSGLRAVTVKLGACSPASDQAAVRAFAAATAIASSARSGSAAKVSTSRDTVGSEATLPNTSGAWRRSATSARQSPPRVSMTARSHNTLAGSCTASGLRHGANADDSSRSNPTARTVSSTTTAPACDTVVRSHASTPTWG